MSILSNIISVKSNKVITQDNDYTKIIVNIARAPKKLYCIGSIPETRIPSVAIVGSRKPTNYGKEITYRLSYDLAKAGIVIISGLAYGIDSVAHQACLDAGGKTLAVMAGGLDYIYPAAHKRLAEDIIKSGGCLISEYPDGTEIKGYQFLERNRLISGLADAVIVTEAALRSGTMSTVASALDQGKTVFAVPGNVNSPLSVGCNNLIKQGAGIAVEANDILEVVAPNILKRQERLPLGEDSLQSKIIALLSSGIRDGDELQKRSQAETKDFSLALTMLEMNGVIRALGANQWTLK